MILYLFSYVANWARQDSALIIVTVLVLLRVFKI